MGAIDKVLRVAESEIGYLEKKSNSDLDSKTANAGNGNWTKYARDLQSWTGRKDIYPNAAAWCDMFVDWCLITAFGINTAKQMIGGWSAYTPTSAQYYKNMGRWYRNPQVGDQIFFKNSKRICHTGLVYKVAGGYVYTIEGNTSGANGVVSNGGGVCKKHYAVGNSRIAGYGRPNYALYKEPEPVYPATVENGVYRLYNKNSGEHFYTISVAERNALIKAGWSYEGAGWKSPKSSKTPVYRVYNPNTGDHHFTISKSEKDYLVKLGWRDEGVAFYSDDSKTVAIYRQYNPNAKSGAHNFTASKSENDTLVKAGWKAEGIAFYGIK